MADRVPQQYPMLNNNFANPFMGQPQPQQQQPQLPQQHTVDNQPNIPGVLNADNSRLWQQMQQLKANGQNQQVSLSNLLSPFYLRLPSSARGPVSLSPPPSPHHSYPQAQFTYLHIPSVSLFVYLSSLFIFYHSFYSFSAPRFSLSAVRVTHAPICLCNRRTLPPLTAFSPSPSSGP